MWIRCKHIGDMAHCRADWIKDYEICDMSWDQCARHCAGYEPLSTWRADVIKAAIAFCSQHHIPIDVPGPIESIHAATEPIEGGNYYGELKAMALGRLWIKRLKLVIATREQST